MKPYAFGVDIGGTTIKMGFFDTEGKFLDKWEITTRTENNGEKVLPDIARSIKKKLKENELTLDDLEGVGVGVPGPVLSGGIVNQCVNLGWGVIDVRKELSSLLDGVFVAVGNDANVAALGEQWNGGGKGHDNVVMVTLGTGVGGGIIIGGKILRPRSADAARRAASSSTAQPRALFASLISRWKPIPLWKRLFAILIPLLPRTFSTTRRPAMNSPCP